VGRVAKGASCSVQGCSAPAVRSLPSARVRAAGLVLAEAGARCCLCRAHYRDYKKRTKGERLLERLRFGAPA